MGSNSLFVLNLREAVLELQPQDECSVFKENNISNSDHPSSMIIITSKKLSSDLSKP